MSQTRKYSFISSNLPANTFHVVSYTAREAISSPYFLDILLISEKTGLEMEDLAEGNAKFLLLYRNMKLHYQGLVFRFEHLQTVNQYAHYRVQLAPRLWALSMNRHSQVFLDMSIPDILEKVLLDTGLLTNMDLEFRLSGNYPKREYVCQYNESHFDFVSRWCEREGIYYYFEQETHGEKLILTDSLMAHDPLPRQPVLRYHPISGMDLPTFGQMCSSFVCEESLVPQSIRLKDYNYRHPSLDMDSGVADIPQGGLGAVYNYGENLKSVDEAKHLAKIRAEGVHAGQKLFKGKGRAPFLRAGYLFTMQDHPDPGRNIDYLCTKAFRTGHQREYLTAGLGLPVDMDDGQFDHHIKFTAIVSDIQFRPQRVTEWPRFYGALNAVVESEGGEDYAHLDEQGRYKIRLPFDVANSPKGKGSCWIRMAQPYGGNGHGMHFPLHNGTEVLLTFYNGDVDRPIIAGALPNAENQSIVKNTNTPSNAIRSAGGNQLVLGDKKGQEFIGMFSPHAQSGIAIGSHKPGGGGSIAIATKGVFDEFSVGGTIEATLGSATSFVAGVDSSVSVGIKSEISAAIATEAALMSQISFTRGDRIEIGSESMSLKSDMAVVGLDEVDISGGINHTVSDLVTKAKKYLGVGIGASIASGLGVAALSRPFDKEFLKEAKVEWKTTPSLIAGGITTVTGAALAILCAAKVKSIAKSYESASNNAKTANILLNKDGVDIKVNSTVTADAVLNMEVDELGTASTDAQKSSIQIDAKGQGIYLTNRETAYLYLEDGTTMAAFIESDEDDVENRTGWLIQEDSIVFEVKRGSGISAETDNITITGAGSDAETAGEIVVSNEEVSMTYDDNKLEIKSNGVTVSASAVNITSTGDLTLNGSTINIG